MRSLERICKPQASLAQQRVWDLVARGMPNKAIAHELDVSEQTVKVHVRDLLEAGNMSNRTQLALEWWGDAWRKELG